MAHPQVQSLSDYLADALGDRADELVDEWIEWVLEHAALRPARMLPREAIRDDIPEVLRGIAELLRTPVDAVAVDINNALASHARLRHDQGYDIEELLKEYEGLDEIVSRTIVEALGGYPGTADPVEVGRIFLRLNKGLAKMTSSTVRVYRRTEVAHKRELHQQLEDYVRTITHELKQPLQAITASAGMLEEEGVAEEEGERHRYLGMLRDGIDSAVALIDDIRSLALVEGAQRHEEWRPLESAVTVVLRQLREQARDRDVRIDVQRPLPRINVDSTRVEIALVNLLSNAIKYSDPEKPERWTRIEAERTGPEEAHRWEIRVTDNGLGIPAAVQPQIFERHFRAHPDVDEGTGLGLAITRQVIEQTGGSIGFESEEGEGSSFRFVVPGYLDETVPPDGER